MKKVGVSMTLAGILMFFLALLADYLGLGDVDPDHFTIGTKQIAGMVLGGGVSLLGILMWIKSRN